MNKKDFLDALRRELRNLPEAEIEKSVSYYSEIIDDTVENGLTEEQAVTALGPMDKIVGQIILDAPRNALVMSKINQRREHRDPEIRRRIVKVVVEQRALANPGLAQDHNVQFIQCAVLVVEFFDYRRYIIIIFYITD